MRKTFGGNHVLMATPFTRSGALDEDSLVNLTNWLVSEGVDGICAFGTTGQLFVLTDEERKRAYRLVADTVRGRVSLGFGVGHSGTDAALGFARFAEEVGADYVLVPAPYYFAYRTPEMLFEHYKTIASQVDLSVMIYDGGCGIEIPLPTIVQLRRACENVNLVKVAVYRPFKVVSLKQVLGSDIVCFGGNDTNFQLFLGYGSEGQTTVVVGNVLPRESTHFIKLWKSGRVNVARELFYQKLLPLCIVGYSSPAEFPSVVNQCLYWRGIIASPFTRQPLLPLDERRVEELRYVYEFIGLK